MHSYKWMSMVCTQVAGDPDIELMLLVKQGDEEAFGELMNRFRRPLTGFFYSLCWNHDTAKDYAQEVLVRLWLARERYEPIGSLKSYIYRVARNVWLQELRSRKCRPQPLYFEELDLAEDAVDIEKLLIRRYVDRRIRLSVAGLPEHHRLVFVLSHFQGLKYWEIAEILEIPIGTVKSRMSNAVRMLREQLRDEMV